MKLKFHLISSLKNKKRVILVIIVLLVAISILVLEILSRRPCADLYENFENPCWDLYKEYVVKRGLAVDYDFPYEKEVYYSDIKDEGFLKRAEERTIYLPSSKVKANGVACANFAFVAEELPERAKKYVTIHENVHIEGERNEARTNYLAARAEPIGFIETVLYSLDLTFKRLRLNKLPCQLGSLWFVFKLYFLKIS